MLDDILIQHLHNKYIHIYTTQVASFSGFVTFFGGMNLGIYLEGGHHRCRQKKPRTPKRSVNLFFGRVDVRTIFGGSSRIFRNMGWVQNAWQFFTWHFWDSWPPTKGTSCVTLNHIACASSLFTQHAFKAPKKTRVFCSVHTQLRYPLVN